MWEYTDEMYHAAYDILSARAGQLDEDELYHHGILGQKWGVRRYQNEDGSLTPAGRKRYYLNGENESGGLTKAGQKWKSNEDRKNREYTAEDARKDREKKIKIALGVAAGLTVAAAATYATIKVKQHISTNLDETIKVGDILGNVSLNDKGKGDSDFAYVYKNKNLADKLKYEGFYANNQMYNNAVARLQDPTHYNVNKIKALKDVKIAGKDSAIDSMKKALDSLSPNERTRYASELGSFGASDKEKQAIINGDAKNAYRIMNAALMDDRNPTAIKVRNSVINDLKARGYGGIKDNNDRAAVNLLDLSKSGSGYYAKANILFNDKSNFDYSDVRKVDYGSKEAKKKKALGLAAILGAGYVNDSMKNDMLIGGAVAGLGAASMHARNKRINSNGKLDQNDINNIKAYKRKGMSNREIAQKLNIAESTVANYTKK